MEESSALVQSFETTDSNLKAHDGVGNEVSGRYLERPSNEIGIGAAETEERTWLPSKVTTKNPFKDQNTKGENPEKMHKNAFDDLRPAEKDGERSLSSSSSSFSASGNPFTSSSSFWPSPPWAWPLMPDHGAYGSIVFKINFPPSAAT
jgi:hypothetical protein